MWNIRRALLNKIEGKHCYYLKAILRVKSDRSSWEEVFEAAQVLGVEVEPIFITMYRRFIDFVRIDSKHNFIQHKGS